MSVFCFEDEQPPTFTGFREFADQLNAEGGEKLLPMTVMVNTPDNTEEVLVILSIEHFPESEKDFVAEVLLGEKQRPTHIWWNEEAEVATVENSIPLNEVLLDFTERADVLPLTAREVAGTEVYELSELGFKPAYGLTTILLAGDPDNELDSQVVVYGDQAADLLRKHLTSDATEFLGHDVSGAELPKFVLPLMNSEELHDLIAALRAVNTRAEITVDITIFYSEAAA